jgi:hypothetical protein
LIRYDGRKLVAEDLYYQHSHDKLIRTEIATLIGLLAQKPIDASLPGSAIVNKYVSDTEALLREVHFSMQKPWFENRNGAPSFSSDQDPFSNAASMREPIFYGGESAYPFQYRDFAQLKYRADDSWLEANRGFRIEDAAQIVDALGNLQVRRLSEHARRLQSVSSEQWTLLPVFTFTADELADCSGIAAPSVQRFLDAFSCPPGQPGSAFVTLSDFNVANAFPVLCLEQGSYVLLQYYSLLEAVYESPFFWMAADKAYSATALANRGLFAEAFVAQRLEAVFGQKRVLRNVDVYHGKNRIGEADALVLFGDRAIVVQAKSKRLTIQARKGNDLQLKDDFKKAIQEAYDQASICANALVADGFRFVDRSGLEVAIADRLRLVFPVCVVSDHYPALAFQARQFLKTTVSVSIQAPLVTDVFAFDAIAEMLDTPLQFINYLTLRARFADKLFVPNELTSLGFHLTQNIWVDSEFDLISLDETLASQLDIAMLSRRDGAPGDKTPKGILTRYAGLHIGRIIDEIESTASPSLTDLGLILLQLGSKTAKLLSAGINRIIQDARHDGRLHDFSTVPSDGFPGLTFHCSSLPEGIAQERLLKHCQMRKYDTKSYTWFGLSISASTGAIQATVVAEGDWHADAAMDDLMLKWPRRPPVPIAWLARKRERVGRNELCPCGSGKKYKKCCASM